MIQNWLVQLDMEATLNYYQLVQTDIDTDIQFFGLFIMDKHYCAVMC